jgi:hypothetical protein
MPLVSNKMLVASIASAHVAATSGPLDVCKTPAPPAPAPIPLPYPNIGISATPGPGYTTKTLAMATPMWTKKGKIALSNGDQPGVALNIMTNKIMGMCGVMMCSTDVEAEGGGVVRTLDKSENNI